MKITVLFLIILFLLPAKSPANESDDMLEDLDVLFVTTGTTFSLFCGMISLHNYNCLKSDEPSRAGGAAGTLFGALHTAYGVALAVGENEDLRAWGYGFAVVGVITTYYGIRNIRGVMRKYREEQDQKLTISPMINCDDSGALTTGIVLNCSF